MFADYSLDHRLLRAIALMGYAEPTPVQAEAIPPALDGRDLRVVARTGSGKTAAYLLPLLHRLLADRADHPGVRALVVLPTRELARQVFGQVEAFARFAPIRSVLLSGGEDLLAQAERLATEPQVIVGTPGRLLEHHDAGQLDLSHVELLVLDEADRMLDAGFSSEVQKLVAACAAQHQTLMFSATGGELAASTLAALQDDPLVLEVDSVRALQTSVRQQIITADDFDHKVKLARWLLANEPHQKAIVFANTRDQADRIGNALSIRPHKVYVLHGDKAQQQRNTLVERLRLGEITVLVATDVAARGLDISDLDLVINIDMPRSGEDYVHRIGRAGRAGAPGLAVSLVAAHEWNLMASVQRYLGQRFERRVIAELKGSYAGPKKLKSSGKAAGSKKKKPDKKNKSAKPAKKHAARAARKALAKPASQSKAKE